MEGNLASAHRGGGWQPWLLAMGACGLTALGATPLLGLLDLTNIAMLFLLTVLLVALSCGRGPAVLASFLNVALFDFFFVPPRISFAVEDAQYLVTFAVMLAVALITAQLTAGLRRQADLVSARAAETAALYELARDLAGTLSVAQVAEQVDRFVGRIDCRAEVLLPNIDGHLVRAGRGDEPPQLEEQLARMCFDQGTVYIADSLAGSGQATAYLPLRAPMRLRGVLAVIPLSVELNEMAPLKPLLGAVASLAAIAVERLHYVEVAQSAEVEIASERLRASILSALSHDVKTPLTALVGLADSLVLSRPPLAEPAGGLALAIRDQAAALSAMVIKLLEMARFQSGQVRPRKEWQMIGDVAGAALRMLQPVLARHVLRVELADDLPLVEFDAVLVERLLCNLLENAAKYSPAGSTIELTAQAGDGFLQVSICDRGRGFPPGRQEALFAAFSRGDDEAGDSYGAGLGLAIARAIVEAHGGSIRAENRDGGGACVRFTLPLGTPPRFEEEAP
ncbi:MAG TPA: DUF4118 domain-containing protein [Rhodocyclaceae bacterium]